MPVTTTAALSGTSLLGATDHRGAGAPFQAINPATGEALEPSYHDLAIADVSRASELATAAFDGYRDTTPQKRAAFLDSIAQEIAALGDDLIARVTAETGIPAVRVRGELARTLNQLRMFADVLREGSWLQARIDPADAARTPVAKPDLRQRSIPLGPVAVFAASNFPLAFSVAGGDTASALAAGAPVIVKAHPAHPGTSELVGRAVRRAVDAHQLPEGTFSLLISASHSVGSALVTDPRISAVGFTGSRAGGLALVTAAGARAVPIPVFAEMSSVNPVFILPEALAARAEQLGNDYIASVNTGTGQLCTSPGLVFVADTPDVDIFIAAAARAVDSSASAPMLSARIAEAYDRGVRRIAESPGIERVAQGSADVSLNSPSRTQLFVTNADELLAQPGLAEEVFGPSSLIVKVPATQLLSMAERLEGQLTATVHADPGDYPLARALLNTLELAAGRIVFNGWPTGVDVGHAVIHGGPFPATTAPATTSVGSRAIERFLRPVAYQNLPEALLPAELRQQNQLHIPRRFDGVLTTH
ncbi:aldehyde dehydrogenase (NADP(+)) [Mycobacterium sp. 48b]|uniref:aldehyde dehydrogenase (NADP(+)) n=1 Tax=Mycobacterium sp. 48b TaxID=3400426 RepID=UPI003AAB5991